MIGAILRNELIKTFHRLAFWVGFVFFAGVTTIEWIENFLRARYQPARPFALPGAWTDIIVDDPEPVFIFAAVVLILLIGSEFTWRTARQNVIDGVSKSQWFAGKLFLIPLLLLLFYGSRLAGGAALAFPGWESGTPLILSSHMQALGGVLLGMTGAMSLAFFIVMGIRSSGAAMGVWLLWFAAIENLIAAGLVRLRESLESVVRFFPSNVFNSLFRWIQYDGDAFQEAVARAREGGRPPPEIWQTETLLAAAVLWIVVLLGASFLWFRRRDL